jgi:hypothetical protein
MNLQNIPPSQFPDLKSRNLFIDLKYKNLFPARVRGVIAADPAIARPLETSPRHGFPNSNLEFKPRHSKGLTLLNWISGMVACLRRFRPNPRKCARQKAGRLPSMGGHINMPVNLSLITL